MNSIDPETVIEFSPVDENEPGCYYYIPQMESEKGLVLYEGRYMYAGRFESLFFWAVNELDAKSRIKALKLGSSAELVGPADRRS